MAKKIKKGTRKSSRRKRTTQSSYNRGSSTQLANVNVILVGSLYDWNVGSVARVITNMGANRLILIRPKCEFSFTAQQAAANGQRPYQNRTVYQSWNEFNKAETPGIRIAFTALDGDRRRTKAWKSILKNPQVRKKIQYQMNVEAQPLYLIFGPEDHGLLAEEMDMTHFNVCLPVDKENESLNLSHAVLLALHMLKDEWGSVKTKTEIKAAKIEEYFPAALLKEWLTAMGYQLDNRRRSVFTILKRTLLESVPSRKDLAVLETLFQQALRKTNEYNELRKKI